MLEGFGKALDADMDAREMKVIEALNTTSTKTLRSTSIWRTIMNSKLTKTAVAAVIIIGILAGIYSLTGSFDGSNIAFAQVLKKIQTSSYTFDLMVEPIPSSSGSDLSPINGKAIVFQAQKLRLNFSNGSDGEVSSIVDYNAKQYLQLFHKSKVGRLGNYGEKVKGDFSSFYNKPVEELWSLKDGSEEFLGEKELHGQNVTGFKVVQKGFEITIWVNSKSGLPVYVEALSEPNDSSISTKWVMKNFDFEASLNEELFNLAGPAEYTIIDKSGTVIRDGRSTSDDKSTNKTKAHAEVLPALMIKPQEGIGSIKFGMTRQQIVEILGKPDQLLGKSCLDYSSSIGLSLLVHSKRGLVAIDFWSQTEKSTEGFLMGADFAGQTSEGIGINSTKAEIVSAFGKEYKEYLHKQPDIFELSYPQLNTIFRLKNNKIIHISMHAAR
jgi:outer membrane lipoprotein-sorting protein